MSRLERYIAILAEFGIDPNDSSNSGGEDAGSAFQAAYCEPIERIEVPHGKMAVCAVLTFDDSDISSDYFNRHVPLGVTILAVVPKQSETERLARIAVAKYPELAGIEFEWKTEKYSMGHGNYLEQKGGFELPEGVGVRRNGDKITHGSWEIQFEAPYRDGQPLHLKPFKGWPGLLSQAVEQSTGVAAPDGTIVRRNVEKNGVEVSFTSKPEAEVIARLKREGFRWAFVSKIWYNRFSATTWAIAHEIAGVPLAPSGATVDQAAATVDQFDKNVEDRMAEQCGLAHD